MLGTWTSEVTLTCCCLCLMCCSQWTQPGMAVLKNQSKVFNLTTYKMVKTVSDHINEKKKKQLMQLDWNFIEIWPNQFSTLEQYSVVVTVKTSTCSPQSYSLYILRFALLISIGINTDVTSGSEVLWELQDGELYLCQMHVVMQNKIICILWSIDKLNLRWEK